MVTARDGAGIAVFNRCGHDGGVRIPLTPFQMLGFLPDLGKIEISYMDCSCMVATNRHFCAALYCIFQYCHSRTLPILEKRLSG